MTSSYLRKLNADIFIVHNNISILILTVWFCNIYSNKTTLFPKVFPKVLPQFTDVSI